VDLAQSILTVEGQGYSFVLPPANADPSDQNASEPAARTT